MIFCIWILPSAIFWLMSDNTGICNFEFEFGQLLYFWNVWRNWYMKFWFWIWQIAIFWGTSEETDLLNFDFKMGPIAIFWETSEETCLRTFEFDFGQLICFGKPLSTQVYEMRNLNLANCYILENVIWKFEYFHEISGKFWKQYVWNFEYCNE